jgi:hypothetical protein
MTLRPDLVFLPLDDDVVVFSEAAQCLVSLNSSAALVARQLNDGVPAGKIAETIVSDGLTTPEEAAHWVTATRDALLAHNLLADEAGPEIQSTAISNAVQSRVVRLKKIPPHTSFRAAATRKYRLLNMCVLIRFSLPEQMHWVDAVIGHLTAGDDATPDIVMDIACAKLNNEDVVRTLVYRDGEPVEFVEALNQLGPVVKAALWQSAVNAYDFLFYIHAGVVGLGRSCVLLPAAAGSGKSSLTAALAHRGFDYFSDEVALIERDSFLVPPTPLALCVKSTGWDIIARYHPDLSALEVHERLDGKVVRYVPPSPHRIAKASAPVRHIIFPLYDKNAATEIKPITHSEALGRLMAECLALRQRLNSVNAGEIVRWIAGIDCYALTFSSLDEASELVSAVVNGP